MMVPNQQALYRQVSLSESFRLDFSHVIETDFSVFYLFEFCVETAHYMVIDNRGRSICGPHAF